MSLSGAAWSADLYSRLVYYGFDGARTHDFTDAVGLGSALHLIGKPFTTVDVGLTPGAGVGTGTGISGLDAFTIGDQIFSNCVEAFGQSGSVLLDFCRIIGASCVSQMGTATLTSTHAPVYLGQGSINAGTVIVIPQLWGLSILTQGASLQGSQWPNFANAIGMGMGTNVLNSGSGTVDIVGGGGPPVLGAGVGAGTIS